MFYKKYIFVSVVMLLGVFGWLHYRNLESASAAKALSTSAIRFHVLANSDSAADQQLKMQVKENVVNYIYRNTGNFDSVEEAKVFIIRNDKKIKRIARETIEAEGYSYDVVSNFGKSDFPEKYYGDVVFPKGNYTSYTLSIGNGKGHNWWCVLYPPLCFVDASTGVVPDSSKERLQESLTDQEYNSIIRYRFKYLTFLNQYLPE
ncbi:MAG: stage II sporulation protein R [Eubacterium sp.]